MSNDARYPDGHRMKARGRSLVAALLATATAVAVTASITEPRNSAGEITLASVAVHSLNLAPTRLIQPDPDDGDADSTAIDDAAQADQQQQAAAEQQQEDDDQRIQQQNAEDEQQAEISTEEQTAAQDAAAQQQVLEDEQQAQQTEQQAGQ